VKVYYDFVLTKVRKKPVNATKNLQEYYPLKKLSRSKPKMRRSVVQKYIKHFINLAWILLIADVMPEVQY
jgi:hypothetical protein